MGNLLNKNNFSKVDGGDDALNAQPDQAPERHRHRNPSDEQMIVPSLVRRDHLLRKNAGDMCDICYRIHRKAAGKAVDPRLLTVLEFFRQLYVRRREVFETSFPDLHSEFDEIFKKHGAKLSQAKSSGRQGKVKSVQRSSSVGSSREISGDDLKLERFKVKTVVVGGDVKEGGKGGQGDKK
ncbi:uncharacterized protein LOC132174782 [Corylus avellana]|uniref:uncharacterized protein LOC132174782 n=1 Tax=Corylus avellana TaxID=13451 RepID=UPI00286B55EA|nr:uncharacterized protein LOC132174782 [Corylus avellana]